MKGEDAKRAFADVLNTSFSNFEKDWMKALGERPKLEFDPNTGFENKLVFRGEKGKPAGELASIPQPKARDHMHLGEMFHARQRFVAAIVEYKKAVRLAGDHNPVLQARLAESLIQTGKPKEAIAALDRVKTLYPSYVRTWILMGRAYNDLKQYDDALENMNEAARINPFDPEIHEERAQAHQGAGGNQKAADARSS